jgi:hypothetical protein
MRTQLHHGSLGAGHEPSGRVAIEPFAVDAHARGDDEFLHRALDEGFEQHGGREVVGRRIVGDLVQALASARLRCQMEDRVNAEQRAPHRRGVTHVSNHQLDLGVEIAGPHGGVAVDLRAETIQRPHRVAVPQQVVREVRADEARATRNQNSLRHRIRCAAGPAARPLHAPARNIFVGQIVKQITRAFPVCACVAVR